MNQKLNKELSLEQQPNSEQTADDISVCPSIANANVIGGFRIIVKTERSGKKQYYIQKRFMLYFWFYLRESCFDISMYSYKIYFDNLIDAQKRVQQEINEDYERYQSKIVKRDIVV